MSSYAPAKVINGKKTFTVLENNPDILTKLAHAYGGSTTLSCVDVYSLNEPSLLALVPRPVLALIAIMPGTPAWTELREREDEDPATYLDPSTFDHEDGVVWFKQTIGEACGTFALVHSLLNLSKEYVQANSILGRVREEAVKLKNDKVEERARILYDSKEIEEAHQEAAVKGDSAVPEVGDESYAGHFVAFVKKGGRLWELEGATEWKGLADTNSDLARKGPIDRGALSDAEDVLSDKAIQQGIGTVIALEGGADLRFSLVALVGEH